MPDNSKKYLGLGNVILQYFLEPDLHRMGKKPHRKKVKQARQEKMGGGTLLEEEKNRA